MDDNRSTGGKRVEFYARSTLPDVAVSRRDEVRGRLRRLADEGRLDVVETYSWPRKIPVEGDRRERRLYEQFRTWADDVGVSLSPFFDTRECYSMDTGDRGPRLVLPALCLAVYRDDRLRTVYPHSTVTGSRTVMDCLEALESGRRDHTETEESDLAEPVVEAAE